MQISLLTTRQRIQSIDILRGIIMVIMAIDHVRDYYSNVTYDPLNLTKTTTLLFFTRWITHFCAPTFVMLSGVSAYLSLSKKESKNQAALFLFKRGLWLIFLEFTVVGFGWIFDPGFHFFGAQVIWAIGCSMLFLSLLLFLRLKPIVIGLIGLVIIFGHNLLDGVNAASFGKYQLIWFMLHQQGFYQINSYFSVFILYPIVPWIGVMAVGHYLGTAFKLPSDVRKKIFLTIGLFSIFIFIFMRWVNIYGDPFPWHLQSTAFKNVLAFINCQKYPPSLLYLLMTLGIAMIMLSLLEHANNAVSRFFMVYGRVPMFYYVLHIYVIHISQVLLALIMHFDIHKLSNVAQKSETWGFNLPIVYLIWVLLVLSLYFSCRWFMKVKERRKDWWLSYL